MAPMPELLIECKKLPGFYDENGSLVKGFEGAKNLNIDDPHRASIQVKDYIDTIIGLSQNNKIERIKETHKSLVAVFLFIAQQSPDIEQARRIISIAIESLEALNQQLPESTSKNYLLTSLEIMKLFIKQEDSLLEIEGNIVQVLGKTIIRVRANEISPCITKVVLNTISLIASERERQKLPIPATP